MFLAGLIGLAALGSIGAGSAGSMHSALSSVRSLPIQHNGRVKPLDSFARETVKQITGESRVGREDPVATVLSVMAEPDRWQEMALIGVPYVPLREALGMDAKARRVSYSDLISTRKLMRMLPAIVEKQSHSEKLTLLENETMDLFDRFVAFTALLKQELHLVPPASPESREWLPIGPSLREPWDSLLDAFRRGDAGGLRTAAERLSSTLRLTNPAGYPPAWRMQWEVAYNAFAPFKMAQLFYLTAAILLAISLEARPGLGTAGIGAIVAGFLLHLAGILLRVILGGRPPVSNFYETMLWIPFVAVAISLVFERLYRVRYFALAAAIFAAIFLALAQVVPLDSSISPVVAVLRSNLWLTIHVLTIVASYGALGLAGILAHLYAWRHRALRGNSPQLGALERFLYHSIQVGVVLLAAGIMLGAVWANASWGRYWGWDPKETWALITLLWFLAVLHGRFAGWLKGLRFALATIGGLFLVGMTYYGVSFYLVGLHSYAGGHAKPLPPLLLVYLIGEALFIVISWKSHA